MAPRRPDSSAGGRPPSTTHAEVERVAFELFAASGFEATTMDDIARALRVGRRTVFRYFPSKNDIVWGDFDRVIERLEMLLAATPDSVPTAAALTDAVVASNAYPAAELPGLRMRMALIATVPALQAHSMLRYRTWRDVVAAFVARRLDEPPAALIPQTVAHLALGASIAAFSHWVAHPAAALDETLLVAFAEIGNGASDRTWRRPV